MPVCHSSLITHCHRYNVMVTFTNKTSRYKHTETTMYKQDKQLTALNPTETMLQSQKLPLSPGDILIPMTKGLFTPDAGRCNHVGWRTAELEAGYPLKLYFQIPCVFPVQQQISPVPIYIICDYYMHKIDLADLSSF